MTEDQTLMELDARARRAAAAVNREVADIPVGTFDPDRIPAPVLTPVGETSGRTGSRSDGSPPATRRWLPLVSIAAAVILLAVTAGLVVVRDGDDPPADEVRSDAPTGLVAGYVPSGFSVAGGGTMVGGEPSSVDGRSATYGPSVEDTRLAVSILRSGGSFEFSPPAGVERVELGGRSGWVDESNGMVSAGVDFGGGSIGSIVGSAGDESVVRTVAAAVHPGADGSPTVDPDVLPQGWNRLAEGSYGQLLDVVGMGVWPGAVAVGYQKQIGVRADSITILLGAGAEADAFAIRPTLTESEPMTIRGHRGLSGRLVGGTGSSRYEARVLTWVEEPGMVARVVAFGVPEDELQRMVDSLHLLQGDELKQLEQQSRDGDLDEDHKGTTKVASGDVNGSHWVVRAGTEAHDGRRKMAIDVTSPAGDVGGIEQPLTVEPDVVLTDGGHETIGDRRVVYGLARSDVVTVRAKGAGSVTTGTVTPLDGGAGWAVVVPSSTRTTIEALDANGKVLGTSPGTGGSAGNVDPSAEHSASSGATATTTPAGVGRLSVLTDPAVDPSGVGRHPRCSVHA